MKLLIRTILSILAFTRIMLYYIKILFFIYKLIPKKKKKKNLYLPKMTNFDYITFHMVSPQILIAIDHVSNYEKIGIMRY